MQVSYNNLPFFEKGGVYIISGYPCCGKTTFADNYGNDDNIVIKDFDSGMYKEVLSPAAKEYWVSYYCEEIKMMYNLYKHRSSTYATTKDTIVFILISSHDSVRARLNGDKIPYLYVVPDNTVRGQYFEEAFEDRESGDKAVEYLSNTAACEENLKADLEATTGREYESLLLVTPDLISGMGHCIHLEDIIGYKLDPGFTPRYNTATKVRLHDTIAKTFKTLYKDHTYWKNIQYTISSNGDIIVRCPLDNKERIKTIFEDNSIGEYDAMRSAYSGVDFVTLDKEDAVVCYELMEEILNKEQATDIAVFGNRAISFERLYDRVSGLIYHLATK